MPLLEVFMSGSAPDHKTLEDRWRQRLKDAALRVDFARNYVKEVQRDFPADTLPSTDGRYLQRALHAQTLALKEYQRVLRIYTDLVVHGKIPDEAHWPRAASEGD